MFDEILSFAPTDADDPPASTEPVAEDVADLPSSAPIHDDIATRFEQMVGIDDERVVGGTWNVSISPRQTIPGGTFTVTVQADLKPNWHVYPVDLPLTTDGGSLPTVIQIGNPQGLILDQSAFDGPEPEVHRVEGNSGKTERYHEGDILWKKVFKVPSTTPLEDISLSGKVAWQMCNSIGFCTLPTGFEFGGVVKIGAREIPEPIRFTVTGRMKSAEARETIEELAIRLERPTRAANNELGSSAINSARRSAKDSTIADGDEGRFHGGVIEDASGGVIDKSKGLLLFLTTAAVFGFAALLTPCVFPMIPITVSFFQKQAEKEHHRPVSMAFVYCLGIIGTFTVLGMLMSIVFGAGSLRDLGNNIVLNLFIGGILVFFALNLLGMFEIRMPSWILTYTAGKESRGGYIGVMFMALTFTLTSFTCTFAFAGLLLVEAMNGDRIWPIMGLISFSAAFSLPFFFLALFPSYLQKLPKSGGWMNVVKVIMGLIELGAAFKYFGTADQAWNGQALVFDYHLMVSAWAVISIAAALYLLGMFRLPHDVPADHIGVVRFVTAMSFLGLSSYLAVGLFAAEKPQGIVWKYVKAFATPTFKGGSDPTGPYLQHGELKYALDFERALEFAVAQNKPLFLDFTGVNCANCRYMEDGPMSEPQIEKRLNEFVRVQLYTDAPVPTIADRKEAERLRDFNAQLQEAWFRDVSLPSYVVIPPDPLVLTDKSKILSRLPGKRDEATFAEFLDRGLDGWKKIQAQKDGRVVGIR